MMIQPAMFALIREGQTTLYSDPCWAALFVRNLIWGHDGLEQWLADRQPVQQIDSECTAGAVIDFDAKALLWYTDDGLVDHPRSIELLDRLIAEAWTDFEILYADGMTDLHIAAGDSVSRADDRRLRVYQDELDPLEARSEMLEEEHEMADEFDPDDEDERFAWITILDGNHLIHHRLIGEITLDVIRNQRDPLDRLKALEPYDVPAEINVTEAMSVDEPSREIRIWGGRGIAAVASEMHKAWPDWHVECLSTGGYDDQCRFSGPVGRPLSAVQALGSVVPILLMTNRMDAAMMLGEIGKSFKGCVAQIVTFLTVLVCLPFAIFALISGNWKSGAITIGIIVLLVVAVFKFIETKWRRGFAAQMAESKAERGMEDDHVAVVAGPMDADQRRRKLDELLRRAGMPGIAEIEPYFESV